MITDIQSDKMVIFSDLHLGNPFCKSKQRTIDFILDASARGYDICINGDGFEIAQVSFGKLAKDVPDVFHALKIAAQRSNVYYVVGNHDILLEHFLNDWGGLKLAPFLNVRSGERRIRVEHGHLYDPFFIRNPHMYEFLTWFAGFILMVAPSAYRIWIQFEKLKSLLRSRRSDEIVGEHPNFTQAAEELLRRGFDDVVFGHTHHVGQVEIAPNQRYFNPGSWLLGSAFVCLHRGEMVMAHYDGRWPNSLRATQLAVGF